MCSKFLDQDIIIYDQIRVIRDYLTVSAAKALVGALVCSRMDYCNGLLFGISDDLLSKLQVYKTMLQEW